jgi:hypothetical protein
VGLWVGKARAMLRNFNEQIERELAAEEMKRAAAAARGGVEAAASEVKSVVSDTVKHGGPRG